MKPCVKKAEKKPGIFNDEESEFLYEVLPRIHGSLDWEKLRVTRKLVASDGLFKKEYGAELKHQKIVSVVELNKSQLIIELKLTYKKLHQDNDPNNVFQRLHRFSLIIVDVHHISRNICEIVITSRQKESKAYQIMKRVFQENWQKQSSCLISDKANPIEVLKKINSLLKEKYYS